MRTLTALLLIALAGCTPGSIAGPTLVDGRGRYELQEPHLISEAPCVDARGRAGGGQVVLTYLAIEFGRGTYDISYRLSNVCAVWALDFGIVSIDSIFGAGHGSWQIIQPDAARFAEAVTLPIGLLEAARFLGTPPTHVRLYMTGVEEPVEMDLPAVP